MLYPCTLTPSPGPHHFAGLPLGDLGFGLGVKGLALGCLGLAPGGTGLALGALGLAGGGLGLPPRGLGLVPPKIPPTPGNLIRPGNFDLPRFLALREEYLTT